MVSYSFKKKRWNYDFRSKNEELKKEASSYRPYLDFYNLKKPPFTITPDPEFFYSSSTHKTAIENILYGIEAGMGFILLIGEVGTGKTTLCRAVLDKLEGRAETVYIINPSLSGIEIIQAVLDDLGLDYPPGSSKKELLDRLNEYLLEVTTEKTVVIIIDDAQTMTPEGLEDLRLLSNLETDKEKLLQLVLAGQQELQVLLSRPELRQLKQRISICCRLELIGCAELKQYISLRLFVAGDNGKINFSQSAVKEIYKASKGIPRLINIICDYALTAGYISNSLTVNKVHAKRAINELRHQSLVDKPFLTKIFSYIKEKRIWLELLILFTGFLFLAFNYREKIFDKLPQSIVLETKNKALNITDSPAFNSVNSVMNTEIVPIANKSEETPVIESEATPPEVKKDTIVEKPENYIIQISSLKTMEAATREGMALRLKGFDVHWNAVHMTEKGTWYRVYQGGFSTKEEAMAFKKEKGINKGIIMHAPWTLVVTATGPGAAFEDVCSVLQKNGLDYIIENDGGTGNRVISGAFISYERAQNAVSEIIDTGLNAKPILR